MKDILVIIGYIFIIGCCMCVTPLLFMLLWNWIVPIFWASAPILTFWQSFGLVLLLSLISKLIFKFDNTNNK